MSLSRLVPLAVVAAAVLLAAPARAESLRCNGSIAGEGDSRLSVLYKCGPPLLADAFCAPVYVPGALYPVPGFLGNAYVQCQTVEDWVYERGPGNLVATVRFRAGVVQSIRYGHYPQ